MLTMITGPYSVYENNRFQRKGKEWYRQAPPYRKPLYYHVWQYRGWHTDKVGTVTPSVRDGSLCLMHSTQISNDLIRNFSSLSYLRAYSSFKGKLDHGLTASAGISIAEASSSLQMIGNRLHQFNEIVTGLEKKDPARFFRAIGLLRTNKRNKEIWTRQVTTGSSLSSNFLEWIFGWKPLYEDIINSIKVLSKPQGDIKIRSGGTEILQHDAFVNDESIGSVVTQTGQTVVKRLIIGTVSVTNPNVDLMNRLGLVNLPQIAWSVIPASFLVDWFLPIGSYLGNYTTFFGRSLNDGMLSTRVTCATRFDKVDTWWNENTYSWSERGEQFERFPLSELPRPTRLPDLKLPVDGLLGRAISLAALFLQRNMHLDKS